jgi:uncharacterized protein
VADRPQDQPKPDAPAASPAPEVEAREVLAYLRQNPDFLDSHPEALRLLQPPSRERGDNVLDFQHFMVDRLRRDLLRLESQQKSLISTGRSNLASQCRVHKAVLAILRAKSFEQLLQIITTDLAVILDVDAVTLGVESTAVPARRLPLPGIRLLKAGTVDALIGRDRDVLLTSGIEGDPALYGAAAGLVRSQALLRLSYSSTGPVGLVCIGTRRSGAFHPGLGTELLGFLARALEITLSQWLALDR